MPTIALVDDDRNILTSLRMVLEAEGYKTQTYNDGASALDGFAESPPDLAILDIKMPRMDGMELLRRVRQKSDMPIIFLTSKDEEIDELFGLKMAADDFIRKPFSQRLLVERVVSVNTAAAGGNAALLGRQLQVGDDHEVVRRVRRPRRGIRADPLDVRVPGEPAPLLERHPGEVDGGDVPAPAGQPERVAPLAGGQVDGPSRREVGQLAGHELVGRDRPDQLLPGVPLVPLLGVHAQSPPVACSERATCPCGRPGSS